MRNIQTQMENLLDNLHKLTAEERAAYRRFQDKSKRQLWQTTAYALGLLVCATLSGIFLPGIFSTLVCFVFFLPSCFAIIVCMNPFHFLPFMITNKATLRIYEWKTRQVPMWMYSDYKRAGDFACFYGDALVRERPELKPDL